MQPGRPISPQSSIRDASSEEPHTEQWVAGLRELLLPHTVGQGLSTLQEAPGRHLLALPEALPRCSQAVPAPQTPSP